MYINVNDKLIQLAREPTNLNYGEIMLLAYIVNFSKKENKFFMTNEAIADVFCTSTRTIKRWLTNLKEHDLIQIYYENILGREKRIIGTNFVK